MQKIKKGNEILKKLIKMTQNLKYCSRNIKISILILMKIILFFYYYILLSNCSFDKKTGIWKNENQVSKQNETF